MVGVHAAVDQELVGGTSGDAVEIAGHKHWDVRTGGNLLQALEEGVDLPELDVAELRVGVDVGVGNADELPASRGCARRGRVNGLQNGDERHVVLQKPAERRLLLVVHLQGLGEGLRRLVELHLVLLHQRKLVPPKERGTAVDGVRVLGEHLGGLLLVDGRVAGPLKLRRQEVLIVVALHLLQAEDVCLVAQQLAQEVLLAVGPGQGPRRAVAVRLGRGVEVGKNVVSEQAERSVGFLGVWQDDRDQLARRWVGCGPHSGRGDAAGLRGLGAPTVAVHHHALIAED
mmetsp:Transcript_8378/g.24021  ORF Transcript_8378/g.24021 Transcript_8378/m.24021 type:complete len:286 (+) Transcript_8378:635-1492(+)